MRPWQLLIVPSLRAQAVAPGKPLSSKSSKAELEEFFHGEYCHGLKEQICDIGRRMWQRAYVDGNGGNIAIRVGEDIALCTPTLVSKGFMKPEDMCLVDFEGNQLCGRKETHERNPHAPANHETPAARGGHCAIAIRRTARPSRWRASSRRRA